MIKSRMLPEMKEIEMFKPRLKSASKIQQEANWPWQSRMCHSLSLMFGKKVYKSGWGRVGKNIRNPLVLGAKTWSFGNKRPAGLWGDHQWIKLEKLQMRVSI